MKLRFFLALALTVAAVGCGGGDDDGSELRTEVQTQCDAIMEHWCNKAIDCVIDGGIVSAAEGEDGRTECIDGLHALCDDAVEVRSNYDPCWDEITAMSCETINTGFENESLMLPTICSGAIGVSG